MTWTLRIALLALNCSASVSLPSARFSDSLDFLRVVRSSLSFDPRIAASGGGLPQFSPVPPWETPAERQKANSCQSVSRGSKEFLISTSDAVGRAGGPNRTVKERKK